MSFLLCSTAEELNGKNNNKKFVICELVPLDLHHVVRDVFT